MTTAHFKVDAGGLDKFLKDCWKEGDISRCFEILKDSGVPRDVWIDFLSGNYGEIKKAGNGELFIDTRYKSDNIFTKEDVADHLLNQFESKLSSIVMFVSAHENSNYSTEHILDLVKNPIENMKSCLSNIATAHNEFGMDTGKVLSKSFMDVIRTSLTDKDKASHKAYLEDVKARYNITKDDDEDDDEEDDEEDDVLVPVDNMKGWASFWLGPDGDMYGCERMGHLSLMSKLFREHVMFKDDPGCPSILDEEGYAEKKGWMKCSALSLLICKKPTKAQIRALARFMRQNNMKKIKLNSSTRAYDLDHIEKTEYLYDME